MSGPPNPVSWPNTQRQYVARATHVTYDLECSVLRLCQYGRADNDFDSDLWEQH